jgi:hypothetical protein
MRLHVVYNEFAPILHCMAMQIVFSSSATVYGDPEYTPLDEKHRLQVPLQSACACVADQSPTGLVVDSPCSAYTRTAAAGRTRHA